MHQGQPMHGDIPGPHGQFRHQPEDGRWGPQPNDHWTNGRPRGDDEYNRWLVLCVIAQHFASPEQSMCMVSK